MNKLALSFVLCGSMACTGKIGDANEAFPDDQVPPTIEVTAPTRGTLLDGMSITVSGRATDADSGVKSVTINGVEAEVMGDGRFEATLTLSPGLTLIETLATDLGDNHASDTRAVLAGQLVADRTPVPEAIVAHITTETFGVLGTMVGGLANAIDFGALARQQNPVIDTLGTCGGARVNVESITKDNVLVTLTPQAGGMAVNIRVVNPFIDSDVDYKILCIPAGSNATIEADAYVVNGWMSIGLAEDGQIAVAVQQLIGSWEGFDLDVSGIPDSFVGLFVDDVPGKVSDAMIDAMDDMLPSMAASYLADFAAGEKTGNVFGREVKFTLAPRSIDFSDQGGTIVVETNAWMTDVTGPGYLVTPSPRPDLSAMADGNGLRMGIADDVANQLLAAFWASGDLDRAISRDDGITGFDALGDSVDHVQLEALLPPMTSSTRDGGLALTLGDLIVDIIDTSGASLTKFAVSGHLAVDVKVREDNTLSFETGKADLTITVLDYGTLNLSEGQLEALTVVAMEQIASRLDQLLLTLPIPTFGTARVASPAFEPGDGYMVLGAKLELP